MKKKLPTPQKLPSGMWRCQVMVDGKRIGVIDKIPSVAQAKAIALREGIIDEKKEKKRAPVLSLSEAIEEYIVLKEGVLSPATVRGYDTIKRNRFKSLMGKNVHDITKDDVQAAVSKDARAVSAKTIQNAYGLVQTVLKQYGINVDGVKLPQKKKVYKEYLQPQDIGKLIEAAKGDSCETEILIAVWLGFRRSEIMGIHWDCIDFQNQTIKVMRTVVPDKENKWVEKEIPKNETSQRVVSCPDYIMEKLRELYKPGSTGRIFKIHPDTLLKHIHRVCRQAGITDTTTHGLRHTNAAVMKSLGINDSFAMARGGWSSEATYKKTYAYIFDQDAKKADEEINQYFQKMHTDLHKQN